jgi:colanic acid/amylovoran biosynthesis glycosyltransferase
MSGSVRLHGAQSPDYIKKILANSDIFVQHSVTAEDGDVESFGISLVEAMATGIPVVVTDHNGFPDTIADGETGFLVPEHDVVEMAEKMKLFLRDPALARRMGEAGSRHARENFDFRITIPRLREAIGYVAD